MLIRPEPDTALAVVSFLIDYYDMPYDVVMSEELSMHELFILVANRTAWAHYKSVKEAAYQQKQEKKQKSKSK